MSITRRNLLFSTAAMAVSCATSVAVAAPGLTVIGGQAFGSTWRMVLSGDVSRPAVQALTSAVIEETNASMSPYLSGSELSRFNLTRSTGWQGCSSQLKSVVSDALAVSRLTRGAFDPTVGPLVSRYGFGPIRGGSGRPEDLVVGANGLRKLVPDMTLDLCGIAKGDALDRIIDGLASLGLASALVELGGEARCLGFHPDGRQWTVGIERPDATVGTMQRIVAPRDFALATSGTGNQGVEFGTRGVSHLIDPYKGHSLDGSPASVSVLAESAIRADALATALMVMGPAKGPEFARDHGIRALFAGRDGDGWKETMTAGFDRHVVA